METDPSQSHAGKEISSYSTEYKLEAIKFAEESKRISRAAKKFNVDRKRIRSKAPRLNYRLQITRGNALKKEVENHLMLVWKTSF